MRNAGIVAYKNPGLRDPARQVIEIWNVDGAGIVLLRAAAPTDRHASFEAPREFFETRQGPALLETARERVNDRELSAFSAAVNARDGARKLADLLEIKVDGVDVTR